MLILKCIETAQGFTPQPPLLLDHFTIFSNTLDLTFPYGTMFSRYSTKKLNIVISKRLLIPLLTSNDIITNQQHYIDTHPLTKVVVLYLDKPVRLSCQAFLIPIHFGMYHH